MSGRGHHSRFPTCNAGAEPITTQLNADELTPEDLQVGDVRLRLWHLRRGAGRTNRPLALLLHGMRDVSRSLLPVAAPLAEDYDLVLVDQRGHGASDYPGAYSMEHFYYDLYRIIEHLQAAAKTRPLALIGHSLGGQIAARFSGLFPELVNALVLIEGLGPPDPAWPADTDPEALDIESYRALILDRFAITRQTRPLPNIEFAAERLQINNPRLSTKQALFTARVATHWPTSTDAQPQGFWAFDPRVATAFARFSMADSVRLWQAVQCPVLTISGDLAHEYWRSAMLYPDDYSGNYQAGEYEERIAHFANIEHQRFEQSGHMVHFDEPEHLAASIRTFLQHQLE